MSDQPLSENWSGPVPARQAAAQSEGQTAGHFIAQPGLQQQPQSIQQHSISPQSGNQQHSDATLNKDQQKWKDFDAEKDGGGAATLDNAQAALDAVAKGPTNKTNPDKDDDHSGIMMLTAICPAQN